MAYCGVTDQQARDAVAELRRSGVLVPGGMRGRAIEYRALAESDRLGVAA